MIDGSHRPDPHAAAQPVGRTRPRCRSRRATVAEVLKALDAQHPGFAERLFDETGGLRRFVNVFVADEDIRFLQGVDTPVDRRQTSSASSPPSPAADRVASAQTETYSCSATFVGTTCSPVAVVDVDRRRRRSTTVALHPGMSARVGDELQPVVVELELLADARDGDGTGRDGRERDGRYACCAACFEPGIGLPCGHVAGSPSSNTSFSSTSAEIACSQRSASRCTFSHSSPITSMSSRSASRCRRTTVVARLRPLSVRCRLRSPCSST